MRVIVLLILSLCLATTAMGQRKKKDIDHAEQGHLYQLVECLIRKDAPSYVQMFPDMDTFSRMALKVLPQGTPTYTQMVLLQENPQMLQAADQALRSRLKERFDSLTLRAEALGIDWRSVMPMRFELEKMRQTRDTSLEQIMPDRYVGYVFLWDRSTRATYCVAISNVFKADGAWYGGQLENIYEARSKDEYLSKSKAAYKRYGTTAIIIPENPNAENPVAFGQGGPAAGADRTKGIRVDGGTKSYSQVVSPAQPPPGQAADRAKTILERHYYTGLFDDEMPVRLYVQYLKGDCPGKICLYDAMYLFGDEDSYIYLHTTRNADGKWVMVEEKNNCNMELTLDGKLFTGMWLNNSDGTGYDVELKEKTLEPDRMMRLDAIMQRLKATLPEED